MEGIVQAFIDLFDVSKFNYGKEILVFIISLLPLLELRGGILAAFLLGLDPVSSYIISVVANILVVPISLFLLEIIFKLLRRIKFFNKIIVKIENKCLNKREQLDKYGYLGLMLFIGIPIPGTGAWTGCFLASLLNMDKKKSFIAGILGVIISSIIMMFLTFGILDSIF